MNIIDIIEKVKHNVNLTREEIEYFINGVSNDTIPDYQISALLMAMWFNPLKDKELFYLTEAMSKSGETADLSRIKGIKADKHSTGGVGDKTTLIIAPIVAAADMNIAMAKMSGRGLGFTGGTIDKLEAIPNINLTPKTDEFVNIVNKTGLCISAQSGNLAPADKKLYALRDVTATTDNISLIASSIMSKKLAAGSEVIVLDVKCGSGAFMKDIDSALQLAECMIKIGKNSGKKTIAAVTDMNFPLGRAVGNTLELIEAVDMLKGNIKSDLYDFCIDFAALIVSAASGLDIMESKEKAIKTIENGKAFEHFKDMVNMMGGDTKYLDNTSLFEKSKYSLTIKSEAEGYLYELDAETVGRASVILGAGRSKKGDTIDYSAGVLIHKEKLDKIEINDDILTLYSNNYDSIKKAEELIKNVIKTGKKKMKKTERIIKILRGDYEN
ncbi:thymidine phosphorylase [Eubacteriales bacterium OttesenSCG-928-G02]|nr:thymidine phosphorylase [Eubacteriales bacterium OttesenSCG-928-G02]